MALAGLALAAPAALAAPPDPERRFSGHSAAPTTTLVTVDQSGRGLTQGAQDLTMTPNGRHLAFATVAPLDARDLNGDLDVYVRDRRTGRITWASAPAQPVVGLRPAGASAHPSLSSDGTRVAFESTAPDLVRGDGNDGSDVFVRDLASGRTMRVSARLDGGAPGPGSDRPAISEDGSVVAFLAPERAVGAGADGTLHVFARTLGHARPERVDVTPAGGVAGGEVFASAPELSADGRLVAFSHRASDLVAGDQNGVVDVFVRDRAAASTQRVSVSVSGAEATGGNSTRPALAADGSAVAFMSSARNLVAGDTLERIDVFVRDLRHAQTSRISVSSAGGELDQSSFDPEISGDGRFVAFDTAAAVVPTDTDGRFDTFAVDRATGSIRRVSPSGGSVRPTAVGATGRHVLMETPDAYDAADGNRAWDGYLGDSGHNASPVASLSARVSAPLEIVVDASASRDPDGWIERYEWSFGDGGSATGLRGPYTFGAPGRYAVVLTVTDSDGATATATITVDIPAPPSTPAVSSPAADAGVAEPVRVTPRAPRNLARPAISGRRRAGARLRCSGGRWEGRPRLSYAWLRGGKPIASGRRYRVRARDRGRRLSCRVTARLAGRPPGRAQSTPVRIRRS